ncbi:hypothetical protein PENNAL_c0112G11339, partial [Penicillium nalgiovense]
MALAQKTAKASSSPCPQGLTPPGSPTKESAMPPVTLKDLMPLFGVFLENALLDLADQEPPNTPVSQDQSPQGLDIGRLKRLMVKLTHDECASAELSLATKPARSPSASNEQEENVQAVDKIDLESPICTTPDDFKSFEKWASKSQFKTVMETNDLDDYAEYAFVVRERVDRTSEEVVPLVDIKSEGLRDILRDVLHDIKAVSLMEDKPSAIETVLSSKLDRCAEKIDSNSDHESAHEEHLLLLIDHLKYAYASALQRLESMLQHGHITNDLLWALFKPGCHVYTTCIGTKEPRCVVFDVGEEITQNDETWLNLECRFVDYDGVKFGEAGIFLRVAKFRGSKPIETLEAFPLHHHPNHEQVRKDLIERGQKFRDLAGSHSSGSGRRIFPMQPEYSRPSLRDIGVKDKGGIAVFDIGAMLMEGRERKKEKMRGDSVDAQKLSEADLLVSCPTVCCFSFKEKMF